MDEFRGLASVVEAWREVKNTDWGNEELMPWHVYEKLRNVLDQADAYMTEIEREPAVNESALPPSMGEKRCNSTHAHVAHRWSSGPIDAFWCVGRRMSALQ